MCTQVRVWHRTLRAWSHLHLGRVSLLTHPEIKSTSPHFSENAGLRRKLIFDLTESSLYPQLLGFSIHGEKNHLSLLNWKHGSWVQIYLMVLSLPTEWFELRRMGVVGTIGAHLQSSTSSKIKTYSGVLSASAKKHGFAEPWPTDSTKFRGNGPRVEANIHLEDPWGQPECCPQLPISWSQGPH